MSLWIPNRRTVLRGLLGGAAVSVALPPLEIFMNSNGTAYAGGGAFPRRFGLFFWGNGNIPDRWRPEASGQGDEWQLSEELMPLLAFKEKVSVATGLSVRVPNTIPHWSGAAGLLSGKIPLGEEGDNTFAGPSIDQILAAEIGGETRYRSIETGCRAGGGLSHNGPNSVNPAETSPHILFERLFGVGFTAPGEEPILDPRLALRRSVLDAVLERAENLKQRVGQADKDRLDQHLTGIRDLEIRLARMEADPPDLAACSRPEDPGGDELYEDMFERNRAMAQLLAMAMACDQTRVFSHVFTKPVDNFLYPGTDAGHHQLTHDEAAPYDQVNAGVVQAIGAFSDFLGALDGIQEGDGTVLDSCAVLATSGVSLGRTHSLEDFPIVLAGSAGGAIRTNVHYNSTTRETSSKVMLTLMRAMGVTTGSFGEGDTLATDGLGALEA